jgi:beta-glucosidase
MFENTYRCAKKAKEIVTESKYWADAELAHRQSVVLLKNDGTLPLQVENKKVYAEAFHKNPAQGEAATKALNSPKE